MGSYVCSRHPSTAVVPTSSSPLWQQKTLASDFALCQCAPMSKTHIIKLRVTEADKAAAMAVAKDRGQTLSDMVRAYLARAVKRAETRDGAK